MLKPSSSRDFAQPRQPDASASSQPARPSQLPFRRATLAEQNSNPLRDPEDMTGYVLDGQREQLEAVFQSPESQFPTDYSRNYMGWALFDTQHNMLAEICRRVSENNPKPGYRILGDQLGTLRAFLMRSGVRVVTDRKGLKWGQDAFREATAEEEKKSPHNSSDVTANIPASEVSKLVSLFGAEGSFKDEYSKSWQGWPLWDMQSESLIEIGRLKVPGNTQFTVFGDELGNLRRFLWGHGVSVDARWQSQTKKTDPTLKKPS